MHRHLRICGEQGGQLLLKTNYWHSDTSADVGCPCAISVELFASQFDAAGRTELSPPLGDGNAIEKQPMEFLYITDEVS